MFKYSFCNLVWFNEEISKGTDRLARFGYDAIELAGEARSDYSEIKNALKNSGLGVSSICALYTADRDYAHPDPAIRKNAAEYVKSIIHMASEIGSPLMGITPTACMKTVPLASREDELKWALEGIREAAELAETAGVKLILEPWNRYEHYWLNRVDQALDLMKQVGHRNVGVMGDIFHMNIEELSPADAIRNAGSNFLNIHLADSNRAAPGVAHFDFKPIIQALKDIDYQGYVSYEILPAAADPFGVINAGVGPEWLDGYAEQSINHIKAIEKSMN
jgi:sugar phosphate isomerase/epimerase